MTLADRLRHFGHPNATPAVCIEAADEIERLEAESEMMVENLNARTTQLVEQDDEIDQLRAVLELLTAAVDREGWPAGWGQIRAQVQDALSQEVRRSE